MNKLFFVFLVFITVAGHAQTDTARRTVSHDSAWTDPDNTGQRDIIDVYHHIRNRHDHPHAAPLNNKTNRFLISVVPAVGYTLQTGFAGILSGNLGFYTSNDSDSKISSITTSFTYSEYNQVIVPLQTDIWTKGNKYNIITDWRYMAYPSETFGLGGHTDPTDGYTINFSYLKFHQSVLKKVTNNLYAGLGYYFDYFWNVREVDPPSGEVTSFQRYGLTKTEKASGIAFRTLYDSRTNQINPSGGMFINVAFRPNFTWMGSDNNWQSLLVDARKYIHLHSGNVLALWSFNWVTTGGKPPYLLLPSTGWDDSYNTGRGYIQGRYRGNNMFYLEAEYRFRITSNGLLGAVLFANAESFSKEISAAYNTVAPGFGTGLRLKLNKHSGANLCLDYGFGADGSKGFFVNLGEVF